MRLKYIIGLYALIVFFTFSSCSEESEKPLGKKWQPVIDSLFETERKVLDQKADSICNVRYDSVYRQTFDSILVQRLEEIKKIAQ